MMKELMTRLLLLYDDDRLGSSKSEDASSSFSSSTRYSRRRGRTKRLNLLLLTTAILLHSLTTIVAVNLTDDGGGGGILSESDPSSPSPSITTSMTNDSRVVTISKSYSSTNFKKAGPRSRGNFSSHNNNVNHNNHAVRRRISLSTLHANAPAALPPHHSNSINPEQPMRRVSRPISSSLTSFNSNNFSSSSNNKRSNKKQKQKSPTVYSSSSSSSSPFHKSRVINSTLKHHGGVGQVNIVQPTMHPLRVLQTEISLLNKTQQQQQQQSKGHPGRVTLINSTSGSGETYRNDKYLYNHRIPGNHNVSMIYSVTSSVPRRPSFPHKKKKKNSHPHTRNEKPPKSPPIPSSPPPPLILKRDPLLARLEADSVIESDYTTTQDSIGLEDDEDYSSKVEGRSAVKKLKSSSDESKQLKSNYNLHHQQLDDNIAEEDHHNEEVTEIVNHYPEDPRHRRPPPPHLHLPPLPPHMQLHSHPPHPHLHHHQHSMEAQFHPHHNYHVMDGSLNNFRPEKTHQRPKLNSYYDSTYYIPPTGDEESQQQQQSSVNHDTQVEFKNPHHQTNMNKNEYDFYSNDDHPPPPTPTFYNNGNQDHPPQLAYLHQQQQHPHQVQYPHHPPYNKGGGEHHQHQDLMSSDATIMDRFEVFYKEYKLLTWASFFIVGSLALLCVLVYLYINNPPTEVVTMRAKLTDYLQDPGILKFLTSLAEGMEEKEEVRKGRRRKKKSNLTDSSAKITTNKEL